MALTGTFITALAGAGTAAAGVTAAAFSTWIVGGSIVSSLLTSLAVSALLGALAPKPSASTGGPRGYQTNTSGTALDHPVIYGEVRVGGVILFDETTGSSNKILHRIIGVAGHEIDSFGDVYVDDEIVTIDGSGNVTSPSRYNGRLTINFHDGSPDQTADADLVAESNKWTNDHRLRGIAYMYVRMEYHEDAFPNGIPVFTCLVKGKKLYNPVTGTTAWSDNPALCLRDYISTAGYGLGEDVVNIDDTLVASAITVCAQTNTNAGTTRYTCNGTFTTSTTPYDMITSLLTSMGGSLWYSQGKWRMKPAYWTTPVMDLTEDDLRSNIGVSTRHSRRDNFNTIKGTFRGDETNWQVTDYPKVTNSSFVTIDGGQESVADVNLSFTDNSVEAKRLALISLEGNRQQLTVNASFGLRTLALQVGDNVRITNKRFGWTNKEFVVLSWSFGLTDNLDLLTDMVLRETAETVFDENDDGILYERDNTILPSAFDVEAVGISAVASVQISNQKVSNIALVNITATDGTYIDKVNVEYKLSSESIYRSLGTGPIGYYEAVNLEVADYDFRARAINTFGVKGTWTYLLDKEINAFAGDPADVNDFSVEISVGAMFLDWTPIPDADLSHYEIKHNSSTNGATWGNSSTIVKKIARPSSSITIPTRSGTFLIKAYDKEENFSVNPATLVVQASELPALGVTITGDDQNPNFTGTKTNTLVASSALEIDDTTAASPTGSYLFDNYIDVGSSVTARVTGYRTFSRKFDGGTPLWDDIPQLFDTWPDNFDTWSDADAEFGDVDVNVLVSVTYDDPADVGATWGSYEAANGSSFVGRGFRFRARLDSTSTNFTPALVDLYATVEY